MKNIRISWAACSLTLCMNTALQAADFTLNVPVDISKMPPTVTTVVVKCAVMCTDKVLRRSDLWAPQGVWNLRPDGQDVVGLSNEVERPINTSTGAYRGTITVSVDTTQGRYPNNAGSYVCAFKFRDQSMGGPPVGPSEFDRAGSEQGIQENSPLVSRGVFINNAEVGNRCDDPNVNSNSGNILDKGVHSDVVFYQ